MSDGDVGADSLGWWAISGEEFLRALRLVAAGSDPDLIYAEFYANSNIERPDEAKEDT